ncbi:MAG TPA: TolC family protein [Polyangia bacterium]|jgi:cobalt-zinc-cadmium efflux system outer membrane protein|nr:TolC family protein [Polyangia bacterium]
MAAKMAGMMIAALVLAGASPARAQQALTIDDAVTVALKQNRDVIAARLDIDAAQLDVVAARVYPNPQFEYSFGNIVLGNANAQGMNLHPGAFSQPVQNVGLSEIVDIWAKRSARVTAADRGVEHHRWLVEDALREIVYAVRSAFADVVREQSERALAHEVVSRYDQTVKISQARFRAGDISEAELRKIELEGLRYQNAVIDADLELDVARQHLAGLMGFGSAAPLPAELQPWDKRQTFNLDALVTTAMSDRPDLHAAHAAHAAGEASLSSARREAFPDISVGANYTHSDFTVSGDNPNTLGLNLALPLPLFDRNQANIGRARLDIVRADNDTERLRLQVQRDVGEAVRRAQRAQALLAVFEGGGMIDRADGSLRVAEKSYKAGAISLLELLEAQRTFLDIRGQYLRALHDYRQSTIDVSHAVGERTK